MPELNIPQTVFTIFYAFAWGNIAEVSPTWKAFDFSGIRYGSDGRTFQWPHLCRCLTAVAVFNLAPALFFIFMLAELNRSEWSALDAGWSSKWELFVGIMPALALFALYRFWLVLVELRPKWFYYWHDERQNGQFDNQNKEEPHKAGFYAYPNEDVLRRVNQNPLPLLKSADYRRGSAWRNLISAGVYSLLALAPVLAQGYRPFVQDASAMTAWLFVPREPCHVWSGLAAALSAVVLMVLLVKPKGVGNGTSAAVENAEIKKDGSNQLASSDS